MMGESDARRVRPDPRLPGDSGGCGRGCFNLMDGVFKCHDQCLRYLVVFANLDGPVLDNDHLMVDGIHTTEVSMLKHVRCLCSNGSYLFYRQ